MKVTLEASERFVEVRFDTDVPTFTLIWDVDAVRSVTVALDIRRS